MEVCGIKHQMFGKPSQAFKAITPFAFQQWSQSIYPHMLHWLSMGFWLVFSPLTNNQVCMMFKIHIAQHYSLKSSWRSFFWLSKQELSKVTSISLCWEQCLSVFSHSVVFPAQILCENTASYLTCSQEQCPSVPRDSLSPLCWIVHYIL